MDPSSNTINQSNLSLPSKYNFNLNDKQKPIDSAQEAIKNSPPKTGQIYAINKPLNSLKDSEEQLNYLSSKITSENKQLIQPERNSDYATTNVQSKPAESRDKTLLRAQEGVTPFIKMRNFYISLYNTEEKQSFESICNLYFINPDEIFQLLYSIVLKMKKGELLDQYIKFLYDCVECSYLKNSETVVKNLENLFKIFIEADLRYKNDFITIIGKIKSKPTKENLEVPTLSETNLRNLCKQYYIRYEKGASMYRFLKIHIRLWNASLKYQDVVKAIELNQGPIAFMTKPEAIIRAIEKRGFGIANALNSLNVPGCHSPLIHAIIIIQHDNRDSFLGSTMVFELINAYQIDKFSIQAKKAISGDYMDPNYLDIESKREKAAYKYAMAKEQIEFEGVQICNQIIREAIACKAINENWLYTCNLRIIEDQFRTQYGRIHINRYVVDYLKILEPIRISRTHKSEKPPEEIENFKNDLASQNFRNYLASLMQSKAITKKNLDDISQTWDEN